MRQSAGENDFDDSPESRPLARFVDFFTFLFGLSAFVREDWISEVVLVLSMYAILIVTILKTSKKGRMPWPALLLACCSLLATLVSVFYPIHTLRITSWLLLSVFFGYASVDLFSFLERSGAIIRAKLLACVGLYLTIGMFYYAVFNLMQEIHPESFVEVGQPPPGFAPFPSTWEIPSALASLALLLLVGNNQTSHRDCDVEQASNRFDGCNHPRRPGNGKYIAVSHRGQGSQAQVKNGTFSIDSQLNVGTRIRARIPLAAKAKAMTNAAI